nr:immunoglobulin heavy chain junction region [Macaca mulatta]MOX65227.1 immunoglobulin heavy chain junction region [Macaca mulatta]
CARDAYGTGFDFW